MTPEFLKLKSEIVEFVHATQPDKITSEPFFRLLMSIERVVVHNLFDRAELKGIPEEERGAIFRQAFPLFMGQDSRWMGDTRHWRSRLLAECKAFTVDSQEYKIVVRGLRRFTTQIDGVDTPAMIEATYVFPVDLVTEIFIEMDWQKINEIPPRPKDNDFHYPPHLANTSYVPRVVEGSMWPGVGVDAIVDTLQLWIAQQKVSLVPRGDGSFTIEVDGLSEIVEEKNRLKGLRRKRREFCESFNVIHSDVVKNWIDRKLKEANSPLA